MVVQEPLNRPFTRKSTAPNRLPVFIYVLNDYHSCHE